MLFSQQRITSRTSDLFASLTRQSNKTDEVILRKYISKNNLCWVGSGREALRQILLNIDKRKVGVPAYTCCVVLDSVRRAGCEPVFYDSSVIADVKSIEKIIDKVNILIVSYNFGFLPEIDKIAELCRKKGVVLIEDCAQAFGASYGGKLVGSFGDYAFYSFGISKSVGFCGGLIANDKKINLKSVGKFPKAKLGKLITEVLISPIFFNKWTYSYTKRFLKSELTKKQESLSYRMPNFAKKVVLNQLRRYDRTLSVRTKNAEYLIKELSGLVVNGSLDFVMPVNGNPSWLYFTILSDCAGELKRRLEREGVEVGEMLTFRCLDGESKEALNVEKKVLTFALYRSSREIKFIANKIKKVVGEINGQ